jgi:hypothetical protein
MVAAHVEIDARPPDAENATAGAVATVIDEDPTFLAQLFRSSRHSGTGRISRDGGRPWGCARREILRISSARYAVRFSSTAASVVPFYCTLPAELSRMTLERTAVSDLSGKCEQKPMPT